MRILALLLALALGASAAEAPAPERHAFENEPVFGGDEDAAPADAKSPSAWGAFGSLAGYTIVIVLMLGGLLYGVKRFVPGVRAFAPTEAIQVLGRRHLTPQASLFLVQVGRRVMRVGLTKDGMSYLGEIADADEVALVRGQCLGKSEGEAFKAALKQQMPPEPEPPSEPVAVKNEIDSIRKVVDGWRKAAAL
ncbi:MAG: flagellar biosynthetic protein FliO [Planctomycetes bacterium]|nr:flagellar biosynthetic protein FliO [Planctomycetota bacterium]